MVQFLKHVHLFIYLLLHASLILTFKLFDETYFSSSSEIFCQCDNAFPTFSQVMNHLQLSIPLGIEDSVDIFLDEFSSLFIEIRLEHTHNT